MRSPASWTSMFYRHLRLPLMTAGVLFAAWACDTGRGVGTATTEIPAAYIDVKNTAPGIVLGDNDTEDPFDVTNPAFGTNDGNENDRRGRLMRVNVVWTSSNPAVVTVVTPTTVTGPAKTVLDDAPREYGTKLVLRGVSKGTATVTGTVTGAPTVDNAPVTVTLQVTVTPPPTRLVASPNPAVVLLTANPVFTARLFSADGTAVPSTASWTCSDTLVAVVISAVTNSGNHCGVLTRRVGLPSDTTVLESDVLLLPRKAGTMRLIATYTGTFLGVSKTFADTVAVTVTTGVSKVVVTPASANLIVGGQRVLSAKALDAAGNVITGLPVTWGSRNPAVVSVDAAGQAKGVSSGASAGQTATANAFATIGGVSGDAALTVYRAPKIVVSPATNTLTVNQSVTLHATFVDSDNNSPIPASAALITWSSDNPAFVKVTAVDDSTATATGVAIGTTAARAFAGVGSGAATVTVAATPVPTSLVVFVKTGAATTRPTVRTNEPLSVGATLQFVTEVRDVNGVLVVDPVVYSSSNTAVATVDASTGLVTAKTAGIAQITSRSSLNATLSSTVAVNVSAASTASPASLKLSPTSATIAMGTTQQFTATLYDASGNVTSVPAGAHIGFAVDDSNVADTTQSGLVSASGVGTST
ncbi:MAG: Ig domain protein group 2 domain protein, partial [Gemmatimonadetes bacterium]|nr:Ig domain protein group 2 domain protein [Gemmatimonadota bacterium]